MLNVLAWIIVLVFIVGLIAVCIAQPAIFAMLVINFVIAWAIVVVVDNL